MYITGCSKTNSALQDGAEVGEDVAVQIGSHNYIIFLRLLDHQHGERINIGVILFDVWIFPANFGEGARPDFLRADGRWLIFSPFAFSPMEGAGNYVFALVAARGLGIALVALSTGRGWTAAGVFTSRRGPGEGL